MTVEQAIAEVRSKARGRTRYAGQKPFIDELLVGEIDRLRKTNAELLEALTKLVNDVLGSTRAYEAELRQIMGNTNYHCITERAEAARAAIAKAKP